MAKCPVPGAHHLVDIHCPHSRYAITASFPRATRHTCFELTRGWGNERENVGQSS